MEHEGKLKLQVRDFGPIVEADIDLRPLTLFVGPSNTGKTYLATVIYALLRLPNLRLFRRDLFGPVAGTQTGSRKTLQISDDVREEFLAWTRALATSKQGAQAQLPDCVAKLVRSSLGSAESIERISVLAEQEFSRCFGVTQTDQLSRWSGKGPAEIVLQNFVEADHEREKPFQHTFSFANGKSGRASAKSVVPGGKLLYGHQEIVWLFESRLQSWLRKEPEFSRGQEAGSEIWPVLIRELAEVVFPYVFGPNPSVQHCYLPADRAGVMRTHRAMVGELVGRAADAAFLRDLPLPTLSGVLVDFLRQLIALEPFDSPHKDKGRARSGLKEKLAANLEQKVLGGAVHIKSPPGFSYPAFYYQREGWKDALPLMRSSSMVSELAPVVLYLRHVVQIGDTLIIEEPEAHLHPAKQVEFMRALATMVQAGIRVIMTTHSEWILEELANLVNASTLSDADKRTVGVEGVSLHPEDVGAWLFRSRQRPKGSIVQEIPLDSDSKLYPAGFDDVAIELHNRGVEIDSLAEAESAA